jgi:hypothetical protein
VLKGAAGKVLIYNMSKLFGLMDLKRMESINNEEIRERREINKGQREGGKTET